MSAAPPLPVPDSHESALPLRWQRVLESIRHDVSEQTFRAWFAQLECLGYESGELILQGPDQFFVDWMTEHHLEPLEKAAQEEFADLRGLQIRVASERKALAAEQSSPTPVSMPHPRPRANVVQPEQAGLRSQYTFANYVIGEHNHLTAAACQAVAEKLAQVYNPLYIHSPSGLGKTHLMQAIGNAVLENDPTKTVHYVSSENFMNELIQAIRNGNTMEFKNRYRTVDLLLIDDIQFLAGRETTQQEFFHTFNALYNANKQIVVTSDCPPTEISALEERLRSRFQWGLITDIQPPNFEERVAILKKKVERQEILIPEDVLLFIAENIESNIRELEGALVRLLAFASLTGNDITLDMAREVLRSLLKTKPVQPSMSINDIIRAVSECYGISIDALRSKTRTKQVARARQMAMYICREHTQASLQQIGMRLGDRDHTTVRHGWQKIDGLVASDAQVRQELEQVLARLRRS